MLNKYFPMLDNLYTDTKIFVIDQETFFILCSTDSIRVANALCEGLINTSTMVVSVREEYTENRSQVLVQNRANNKLGEGNAAKHCDTLPKDVRHGLKNYGEVDKTLLKKKELCLLRKEGLEILEQNCIRFSARNVNFINDDVFLYSIGDALKNTNSSVIQEWADIKQLSYEEARNELQMIHDSVTISTVKMNAVWRKFVDKINTLYTRKDIITWAMYNFERELYLSMVE